MIIKCIYNNYSKIEMSNNLKNYLNEIHPNGLEMILPLIINKIYNCYAIAFGPFVDWLFVVDEHGLRYPTSFPSILFSFEDKSVSRYWKLGIDLDSKGNRSSLLAFEEWSDNEYFHGDMFEGDFDALSLFESYKKVMDVEFPRPDITETPKIIGDNWVLDFESGESWECNHFDALTIVPNSNKLVNNPYYNKSSIITL